MDAVLKSTMVRATLLAAILVAAPALAQAPQPALGDSAKGLIGSWEFSNADRDKICTATFADKKTPAGLAVTFSKDCDKLFPVVANVAGWVFPDNDLLRLVDTDGRTLIEFSEVEDGVYEAPTPGLGVLFLQNAASAAGTERFDITHQCRRARMPLLSVRGKPECGPGIDFRGKRQSRTMRHPNRQKSPFPGDFARFWRVPPLPGGNLLARGPRHVGRGPGPWTSGP